jgi:hypothetical protein
VRANTLSIHVNDDRTIRTGICNDPYWKEVNLSKIYPYAALQFLCVQKWNTLSSKPVFSSNWNEFNAGLTKIYGSKIVISGDTLDKWVFKDVVKQELCKTQDVRYEAVQDGLQAIHNEYETHIKTVWKLLSELVEVIQDPDTNTEMVRLVAAATATGSQKYVNAIAERASKQIIAHYLRIEEIYYSTMTRLVPKT